MVTYRSKKSKQLTSHQDKQNWSDRNLTSKSEKNGHVLGLEKSFFLSPLHHDVYSCSRASLLPFRVVNHGGLTLY